MAHSNETFSDRDDAAGFWHLAELRRLCGRLPWRAGGCAAIGIGTPLAIHWGGNLPITEILLLLTVAGASLYRLLTGHWPLAVAGTRWFGVLLIAQMIAVVGYMVSDLYRGSAFDDVVRGWSRMLFVAIDLVGLACWIGPSWRNLRIVKLGVAAGLLLDVVIHGPLFDAWWKFGLAMPVTLTALAFVGGSSIGWSALVAATLGGVHFVFGFRSLGAECLAVAVVVLLVRLPRAAIVPGLAGAGLILGAVVWFFSKTFPEADVFSKSSDLERSAMMQVSTEAFVESPLIGHGSWFSNSGIKRRIESRLMQMDPSFGGYHETDLAVHSQLLVSLAEGGIFGGSFFVTYVLLLARALVIVVRRRPDYLAFALFLLVEALFNVAICPFSGPARLHIASAAVLGLLLTLDHKQSLKWKNGLES